MRLGRNPNADAKVKPFAPVVVLVVTHLPDTQSDYHKGRAAVIYKSIASLKENIGDVDYDLIVWDNGSSDTLFDVIGLDKRVTTILSRNVGKINALKYVMRMLPPGTILAYGDDDIEYFPNWLAPQIEILKTYPNVGTVTGWPVRIAGTWGVRNTVGWAGAFANLGYSEPTLQEGRFIPDEWERDYAKSIGLEWKFHLERTKHIQDYRITYRGVSAYAMSQHCQFVCYPERIEPLIKWTDKAMPPEQPIDEAIDAAGMLRLATVDRLTRHMGNVLERT